MAQREQMYFGSFCRGIAGEIIHSSTQAIEFDSSGIFTKNEKQSLHDTLILFRFLCVVIKIMEKTLSGEIHQSHEENGRIFIQALQLAYEDNKLLGNEEVSAFEKLLAGYSEYIRKINEADLAEKGFGFYACEYITGSFVPTQDTTADHTRYNTLHDIVTYLYDTMDHYFEETFKKVQLIDT